ncbi:hypothetical protein SAMN05216404_101127 [Nitrosospira multiformis]|uniref:Uncharacterized protein n=1 Tax=Nitrosospira multiformis TaxID=1231 RepID=A0A1H8B4R5_9PROT|nr:hypothetical protein [Nitrosospira multiformis]SEM77901.1 hypothetical protein SAMN05216404_101127 [Nitrosospira multiformis]
MSELVVVGFKDAEEADRVLLRLAKLKKEHLIDLEDAVVVIRDEGGRVHLKQSINPTINGATTGFIFTSGSLWGALIGLLFMHPIAGFVWAVHSVSGQRRCPALSPTTASTMISSSR